MVQPLWRPIKQQLAAGVAAKKAKKPVNLLFVIKVKKAKLVHIKGKEYRFTFDPANIIGKVTAFTDRPNRRAFRMSFSDYLKMTSKGADSFIQDPPNVVLSWAGDNAPDDVFTLSRIDENKKGTHAMIMTIIDSQAPTRAQYQKRDAPVDIFIDFLYTRENQECELIREKLEAGEA